MSFTTNETLEYAILNDDYKPIDEEIKQLAQELWDLKLLQRNNEKVKK